MSHAARKKWPPRAAYTRRANQYHARRVLFFVSPSSLPLLRRSLNPRQRTKPRGRQSIATRIHYNVLLCIPSVHYCCCSAAVVYMVIIYERKSRVPRTPLTGAPPPPPLTLLLLLFNDPASTAFMLRVCCVLFD